MTAASWPSCTRASFKARGKSGSCATTTLVVVQRPQNARRWHAVPLGAGSAGALRLGAVRRARPGAASAGGGGIAAAEGEGRCVCSGEMVLFRFLGGLTRPSPPLLADGVPAAPGMAGTTPAGTTPAAQFLQHVVHALGERVGRDRAFPRVRLLERDVLPEHRVQPLHPADAIAERGEETTASRLNCSVACGGEVEVEER